MIFNEGRGELRNFILSEGDFREENLAKCESVMCQGNGYMCVRGALEELASKPFGRFTLVAGTFNKLDESPCNELPNTPDFTEIGIYINGRQVTHEGVKSGTWHRALNMKTGLLERSFIWTLGKDEFKVRMERVVSLKSLHLAAEKIEISPASECIAEIKIVSGINGTDITASEHLDGVRSHCTDGVLQTETVTTLTGIPFVTGVTHKYYINGKKAGVKTEVSVHDKKKITETAAFTVDFGGTFTFEKTASVFSGRDRDIDAESLSPDGLCAVSLDYMKSVSSLRFDDISAESAAEWDRRIWSERDVVIGGKNADRDQLAVRFALYQLTGMSPVHDNRMNIGAKGLSGPGYYGHAFWDTEMYMLPYFIFAAPDEARSLCEYRYNGLSAARENAKKAGFSGARFPWESAWITDGEATPVWCDTGDFEIHITADVAFGAYYYYMVSGDEDFMERCGYELILDCAKFWSSRLDYNKALDRYEIRDVIGPNEYKCHISNNAYTNYMAHNTIVLALEYTKKLKAEKPATYKRLDAVLDLEKTYPEWQEREKKLFLPGENAEGIIPQDETYLTLPSVVQGGVGISLDPGARERAGALGYPYCMVSKQADVVSLLYVLEDLFSPECKRKNFCFYDLCCFHDSSLSLSTFSALAADLGEDEMAYSMFTRATLIDIGEKPDSSDNGVHAASLGGVWQCCVLGFGGVRRYGNQLRIEPHLPKEWDSLSFAIYWHGERLKISVTHSELTVLPAGESAECEFVSGNRKYKVGTGVKIPLSDRAEK